MSVLDKLLDAVKLNDDYDEDDYLDDDLLDSDDDDFLDDDQEDKPVKKFFQKFSKKADDEEVDDFDDEEPVAAAPKQPVKTVSTPKVSVKQDKRYEVLHPRSLQCEAAERDHRQQIWKYV